MELNNTRDMSWKPSLLEACERLNIGNSSEEVEQINDQVKQILLDRADVHCEDGNGNTALHYAAAAGSPEIIIMLLEAGSYIGHRNKDGISPLEDISPECLSQYLDNCLSIETDRTKKWKHRKIHFDLQCLFPDYRKVKEHECDRNLIEMQPFVDIAKSKPHRYLLKHPILSSVLCLKWKRIRPILCASFLVYILFCALLSAYVASRPCTSSDVNTKEKSVSNDSIIDERTIKLVGTLATLTTYAGDNLKNGNRPKLNESNVNHTTFLLARTELSLTAKIIRNTKSVKKAATYDSNANGTMSRFPTRSSSDTLWFLTLTAFICRVIVQLVLCPNYFLSSENWLELLLICLGLCSLTGTGSLIDAVVIVLAAWELIYLIGRHPSTSLLIESFKIIARNFLHVFSLYLILIIPFAFAIHLVFRDEEHSSFYELGHDILITIFTLIKEFDADQLPHVAHHTLGHILLICLIFLITAVMFNLLITLANMNTEEVIDEAEIQGLISRIKLLSYVENVIVGSPLSESQQRSWHRFFSKLTAIKPLGFLSERILLRRDLSQGGTSVVLQLNTVNERSNLTLDQPIITQAEKIISAREQDSDTVTKIVSKVNQLFESQKRILCEMDQAAEKRGERMQVDILNLFDRNFDRQKKLGKVILAAKDRHKKELTKIVNLLNK